MSLSGQLIDYSLPELFNTIEQGSKTGMLTIRVFNEETNAFTKMHLSFKDGFLIALSDDLIGRDLVDLINANRLLDETLINSLIQMDEEFKLNVPLGVYLQSKNQLNETQVQKLFDAQVIEKVIRFYELPDAWFTFNPKLRPTMLEQTGLRIRATKLNLIGLRVLKNWDHLLDKLPEKDFALLKIPQIGLETPLSVNSLWSDDDSDFSDILNPLENKIVQRSDGKTALSTMATELRLPLTEIQKVAFQLIFAGMVDELPMVAAIPTVSAQKNLTPTLSNSTTLKTSTVEKVQPMAAPSLNAGFLESLSGFLKNKILLRI